MKCVGDLAVPHDVAVMRVSACLGTNKVTSALIEIQIGRILPTRFLWDSAV